MAKNKKADYKFQTDVKYLTRVISVRWTALPSISEDTPALIIQVKLGSICTHPKRSNPELCGGESVVFIPVNRRGIPEGKGRQFLKDIGVAVSSVPTQEADLTPKHTAWVLCTFGKKEQLYGYQSIVHCVPATNSQALKLATKAIELNNSRKAIPGLRIDQDAKLVNRSGKPAKIKSGIRRHIFCLLVDYFPYECSAQTLLDEAWKRAGLNLRTGTSELLHNHIWRLRDELKDVDLEISKHQQVAYRLIDLRVRDRERTK